MGNHVEKVFIDSLLSNLHINIYEAYYLRCPLTWRETDYIASYNKFYFICEGEGWIKIGDQEFMPEPGQLFFMPDGVLQSYSCINENPYLKYWVHFKARIGEMNLFDVIKLPFYINVSDNEYLKKVFDELVFYYNRSEIGSKLMAKSKLFDIIAYFIRNIGIENMQLIKSDSSHRLSILLEYINKNISKPITVDELAKIVYLHPNYLIKIFKNHFGMSPIQYINSKRIGMAKELLSTTEVSVSRMAEELGFGSVFYFSKIFKKQVGIAPQYYRNLIFQKGREHLNG